MPIGHTKTTTNLYTGTKTLFAWPQTKAEYCAYRGWPMPADEDATEAGYLVEYCDGGKGNDARHEGYISWSPADVFEQTYHVKDQGQSQGLPVAGYKPTQSGSAITMVNSFKELEERVLRRIEECERNCEPGVIDPRLMAIGRTQLQGAFMFLCRAVFQPQRVKLPGDDDIAWGAAGDEHPGTTAIQK